MKSEFHSPRRCALFTLSLLLLAGLAANRASAAPPGETAAEREARMAWFNEARFGMFIHWGLYAIPAGEWRGQPVPGVGEWIMERAKIPVSEYEPLAREFNPVKFDAAEWVRIATNAGMKYLVITSKHHDGFGLWPSQQGDWNIRRTPFQRDPLQELADACAAAGIRFCLYHSIMDWHHPDYGQRRAWHDTATAPPDMDRYVDYMKAQLRELLTGYGPIGILWFDGEWERPWTHERGVDLDRFVRGLQPRIIVNNRVGKGRAGMSGMNRDGGLGDYGTPEQEIPPTGFGPGVYWESCMTMNDTWGFKRNDHNWKSPRVLLHQLIDCASKGGNYLLNVGPTAEGEIPAPSVERLAEMGRWLRVNSAAIYGTTASPFKRLPWGRCTARAEGDNTVLYLHVFDWPANGELLVPGLKNRPVSAALLADGKPLAAEAAADGVRLKVPATAPDAHASVIALRIAGAPDVETFVLRPDAAGRLRLTADEAELHGALKLEGMPANIGFWTRPTDWVRWEFHLPAAARYEVHAELASEGGGQFELVAGERKLRGEAKATGGYQRYERVRVGELDLSAGDGKLELRAVREGWSPLNVRGVELVPATNTAR